MKNINIYEDEEEDEDEDKDKTCKTNIRGNLRIFRNSKHQTQDKNEPKKLLY